MRSIFEVKFLKKQPVEPLWNRARNLELLDTVKKLFPQPFIRLIFLVSPPEWARGHESQGDNKFLKKRINHGI
jgi:hypothetical protein